MQGRDGNTYFFLHLCSSQRTLVPHPPRQRKAKDLHDVIEQLSANKADRRELLDLKQFMVSLTVSFPAANPDRLS